MHLRKLLLGFITACAVQTQAIDFIATNAFNSAADTSVAQEQWIFAQQIQLDAEHQNDLFLLSADSLNLSGTFSGNLWGMGGMHVLLSGPCERNVRLLGKALNVNSTVEGNAMLFAETVIVETNAVIKGDALIFGTSVIHKGRISGNVEITAGRLLTLDGVIEGNAKIIAPEIVFSNGARILGNLNYTASREIFPDEKVIEGSMTRTISEPEPLFSAERLTSKIVWFFAAFLTGIPFVSLFPMTTAMATQLIRKSPLKCLLVGLVTSIILPVLGGICITSFIGVPLGSLMLGTWAAMAYLSRIILGLLLGTLILRSENRTFGRVILSLAVGLAIIYLSSVVPSIGLPVQLIVTWLGMGAFILSLLEKRRLIIQVPQNLKKLEELRDEKYNPEEE